MANQDLLAMPNKLYNQVGGGMGYNNSNGNARGHQKKNIKVDFFQFLFKLIDLFLLFHNVHVKNVNVVMEQGIAQ